MLKSLVEGKERETEEEAQTVAMYILAAGQNDRRYYILINYLTVLEGSISEFVVRQLPGLHCPRGSHALRSIPSLVKEPCAEKISNSKYESAALCTHRYCIKNDHGVQSGVCRAAIAAGNPMTRLAYQNYMV